MQNGAASVIHASQQRNAAHGGKHIGDLISWNGEGVDVLRTVAREAFGVVGFETLVPDMTPSAALTRGVGDVPRPAGIRVQALVSPNPDTPVAYGVYTVSTGGESGDKYQMGARVRVDMTSDTVVALPPEGAPEIDGACGMVATQIADRAMHLVQYAQTRDIGAALVNAVRKLAGVPLRDRGGFYLLPPSKCGTWATLKTELEKIGMRPLRIEMHDAPDNVQAASGAAKSALEEDVKELMADLEKAASDGGMKEYKIERRVAACRALAAKAELFRGVLQSTVDEIRRRTELMAEAFRKLAEKDDEDSFAAPPVID